jgi:hypothetical protein
VKVALSLLREMPQLRVLVVATEIVPNACCLPGISACVKGAQWEVSTSMLREMPQSRPLPNEISFFFLFVVWHKRVREKGPGRLMSLLRKMPQRRRMPNAFCLASISAC